MHEASQSAYALTVPLPAGHFEMHSDVAFACDCDGHGTPTHFAWQQTSADPPDGAVSQYLLSNDLWFDLHFCKHMTCAFSEALLKAVLVGAIRVAFFADVMVEVFAVAIAEDFAVVVAFCAVARATSPKAARAVKKRMVILRVFVWSFQAEIW